MQFSDKEENYRLILIFGPPLRTINRGKDLAEWKNGATFVPGKLAEWSIAAVLKTVELQGSGGSNPSLSATGVKRRRLARSMPGFASRRVKPGLFVLSRAAVVAEKTARRCNIFPLANPAAPFGRDPDCGAGEPFRSPVFGECRGNSAIRPSGACGVLLCLVF